MTETNDLSTWSMKELLEEDRRWGAHDMNATEVRAEIARRRSGQTQLYTWITVGAAVVSSLAAVIPIFHSK
jgi:hypothetical protein